MPENFDKQIYQKLNTVEEKTDIIDTNLDSALTKIDVIDTNVDDIEALVGLATDAHTASTLFGRLEELIEHTHTPQRCYPTLAAGVTLTTGSGAWTLGNFIEVVPANTITSPFDLHHIVTSSASGSGVYQIEFYSGTVGNEIFVGCVRGDRSTTGVAPQIPLMTPIIAANSRISAKAASDQNSGTRTINVSLLYHTY